jgi:hypothetical protein
MIAVALSPNARALIQAHHNAGRPTAADRERITSALRERLGSTVLPFEAPISTRLVSSALQRSAAAALGMCVVGSVLLLTRAPAATVGSASQQPNRPAVTAPAAIVTAEPSEPALTKEEQPRAQRKLAMTAPRHTPAKASASPALDRLAEEVVLLSSATNRLSTGQAERALLALEEHQRRFSSGALSDERNAARARALCALHRLSEGRAALALLAPGTPLAARAKEDCDSASKRADAAN